VPIHGRGQLQLDTELQTFMMSTSLVLKTHSCQVNHKDVLLNTGEEVASHYRDCWLHFCIIGKYASTSPCRDGRLLWKWTEMKLTTISGDFWNSPAPTLDNLMCCKNVGRWSEEGEGIQNVNILSVSTPNQDLSLGVHN